MMKMNFEGALTEVAASNQVEVAGDDAISGLAVLLAFLMYGWMYRRGPMVEVGSISEKHVALFKDFYRYTKSLPLNSPASGVVKSLVSTMSLKNFIKRLKEEERAVSYLRSAAGSNASIITIMNALDDSAWKKRGIDSSTIKMLKQNGVDDEFIGFASKMVKLGKNSGPWG